MVTNQQSPVDLPSRQGTQTSTFSDDAVPETDPNSVRFQLPIDMSRQSNRKVHTNRAKTAGLLAERLQAWKHAVVYLEEYMGAVEKIHHAQAKEYERALKVSYLVAKSFSAPVIDIRAAGHFEAP